MGIPDLGVPGVEDWKKGLSELKGSLRVSDWVCRKWELSYKTILMWGSRLVGCLESGLGGVSRPCGEQPHLLT